MNWEERMSALWASLEEHPPDEFRARIDALVAELPENSAIADFERACAWDSTGHSDRAAPLYQRALDRGLEGLRRRRAIIQMASSLRNLGRATESLALLRTEKLAGSDELEDAVSAFLALALVDCGKEREAVATLLQALVRHLPRYQRSVQNYARLLLEDEPGAG